MKILSQVSAILAMSFVSLAAHAQQPRPVAAGATSMASSAPSQTQRNIEAYLRNLYAFGSDVKVVVGPLKETPVEGLLETSIDVTVGENKEAATFYVSKDGQFLFRGEL